MAKKRITRLDAAINIRDAAIKIVRRSGKFQDFDMGPILLWESDGLVACYSISFQSRLPMSDELIKKCLSTDPSPKFNLSYGLDVWNWQGVGKVLNIGWSDKGDIKLVSFRRGDWERKILGLARFSQLGVTA